jgi:hypothetical protein
MKTAFLILAHANPAFLKELVTAINRPPDSIFVHIDKKADEAPFRQLCAGKCTFVADRETVYWGRFSIIQATLNLIKAACSTGHFDYYCLLSGCDYPIKPVADFERYLSANRKEFITHTPIDTLPLKRKRYTGFYFWENKNEFQKKLNYGFTKIQRVFYRRKPYKNRPLFFGAQWWTLSSEAIQYILDFLNKDPGYNRYFKYTHCPDEMFFQTIIMHSPFAGNVVCNNLRCIHFIPGNAHPKTWTMADKETLLASPAYFARKFDMAVDAQIISFLNHRLTSEV